jgi:hypothetical protein
VASKLSRLAQQLRPYVQKRHEEERRARGDGAADSPYDLDYLRELGLDEVAEDLEGRLRALAETDGEEDPGHEEPETRAERDLTTDIDLPADATAGADGEAEETGLDTENPEEDA